MAQSPPSEYARRRMLIWLSELARAEARAAELTADTLELYDLSDRLEDEAFEGLGADRSSHLWALAMEEFHGSGH